MATALTADEVEALTERICGRKIQYGARSARVVAERWRARGIPVSPYRCPICGHWHLGHVPSMETVASIAQLIRQRAYPPQPGEPPR